MGRRPVPRTKAMTVGGNSAMSAEVKSELNDIALLMMKQAKLELVQRIKDGKFKDLTLSQLLKEVTGMTKALQGPATSITAVNIPMAPQPGSASSQPKPIEASLADDPENIHTLREQQKRFLNRDEQGAPGAPS